jgi:hypothetical protein
VPHIRCPQCGAVNDTRAPDYPFCLGCQTNLAKCGYCRWFDEQAGVCTHRAVAGLLEVSEDATPPCGYHTPRDTVFVRRSGLWALAAVGLATAVFALGYAVVRALQPAAPPPQPAGTLQLAVESDYRGAAVGQLYVVTVQIYNASDAVVEGVRFEIARESLGKFHLREVRPEPSTWDESAKWQVLCYPELHPRERRTLALDLVPRSGGTFHLIVRLVSGDSVYHGMADLPIAVSGPQSES